jgi:hypothetical protein
MIDDPWPNLFIVGAAKAGTTSLYHYLAQHPDIYMAPVKEPHFFSRIHPAPELEAFFPHVSDEADYLSLFANAHAETVRGEASTSYLSHPDVADAIWQKRPEAKIVIMLRDPVERAYSNYWYDVREASSVGRSPRLCRKSWLGRPEPGACPHSTSTAVFTPTGSTAISTNLAVTSSCSSSRSLFATFSTPSVHPRGRVRVPRGRPGLGRTS